MLGGVGAVYFGGRRSGMPAVLWEGPTGFLDGVGGRRCGAAGLGGCGSGSWGRSLGKGAFVVLQQAGIGPLRALAGGLLELRPVLRGFRPVGAGWVWQGCGRDRWNRRLDVPWGVVRLYWAGRAGVGRVGCGQRTSARRVWWRGLVRAGAAAEGPGGAICAGVWWRRRSLGGWL